MKPHIDNYNPDPTYIRALLDKAGLSQRKTTHILGLSERIMRYYLVSTDDPNYHPMPYTVQFAIECLAQIKNHFVAINKMIDNKKAQPFRLS